MVRTGRERSRDPLSRPGLPRLGALALLFPTRLIGVCANPAMPCNLVEKPALIYSGIVAIGASLVAMLSTRKDREGGA